VLRLYANPHVRQIEGEMSHQAIWFVGRNGDLKGSILANLLLIRQLGIAKTGRVELRHSKIRASRTDRGESEQTLPIMERMGFVKEEVGRNHLAG
jgi:hypothetical protein